MFLLTEVNYRITRTLGRTLVLALAALMLVASMGAYLSNLHVTQAAIEDLEIPVTVRIMNRKGTADTRLSIATRRYDALASMDVHGVLATAGAAGAVSEEAYRQNPFVGGDATITGTNSFTVLSSIRAEDIVYCDGYNAGFLEGCEPVCAASDRFAQDNGLAPGDKLSLPVHFAGYSLFAEHYKPIGFKTLLVAAVYPYSERNGQRTPDLTVPVEWLRAATEAAGYEFTYSSLSAVVDNPMELNRFKEELKSHNFKEVNVNDRLSGAADAVSVEDELFVRTAEELLDNLAAYQVFQLPFFGLVTVMVMLTVFLVLRGARRDMAIASSLGEARLRISFVHFSAAVLIQMLGGCLALAVLILRMGISPGDSLLILLAYLLCACLGTALALTALLRFDTLELLTKTD